MSLYRAACNIVDNTVMIMVSRWGGFNPSLAVVSTSWPQQTQVQTLVKKSSSINIKHRVCSFLRKPSNQ